MSYESLQADAVRVLRIWRTTVPVQDTLRRGYHDHLSTHPDAASRTCADGHLTASCVVFNPMDDAVALVMHKIVGRWLQPGGHWEEAESFHASAAREAVEETGVRGLRLHPWHAGRDLPFAIDSHDVPGKPARGEAAHIHHDLQYLFLADPALPLVAQVEEVHAAAWKPITALAEIAPRALERLSHLPKP